jgi:hypothetical protein
MADLESYAVLLARINQEITDFGLEEKEELTKDEFEELFMLYGKKWSLLKKIKKEVKEETKLFGLAVKSLEQLQKKYDFAYQKEYAELYLVGPKIVFKNSARDYKRKIKPKIRVSQK